ncbi:RnfABCDGE type electron transport complex subunit B [Methylophilus sp.]|jgi:electron transport complex protein RnfB|uniref:RnfABCDGE type electron transport complex subunit B n=1 Tax=Methylophilus sp. TaxID=29541 RepID=UPI0011D4AE1E|nr:RnfABCDGE type electron transport complex subunit B [Methylophilus sp.]TXI45259.1 MAG: RnfABCDGE type electron transport complex subunit B [Methylophilus sp.]
MQTTRRLTQETLIAQIDALLPQTQCRQCGYDGCKPYATAIANSEADINQCPPGGDAGIHALAALLQRPYQPLNLAHGVTKPKAVAVIDEATCIGCTLCISACPVDAILGAAKFMHTVISQECTGCELCLPPCPVDCISMHTVTGRELAMNTEEATLARRRHEQRNQRQALEKHHKAQTYHKPATAHTDHAAAETTNTNAEALKKAAIAAAMARVKAQKAG